MFEFYSKVSAKYSLVTAYFMLLADKRTYYHVTTASRLKNIAKAGLVSGQPRSIGGPAYDGHVKGNIFLTSGGGVRFWFDKAIEFIEHGFDPEDLVKKGQVPVVLKIELSANQEVSNDAAGTTDSGHPAFVTSASISPSAIQWFSSGSWRSLSSAVNADFSQGVSIGDDDWDVDLLGANTSPFYPKAL